MIENSSLSFVSRLGWVGVHLLTLPVGLAVLAFSILRWLPRPPSFVDSVAMVLPWLIFPLGAALLLSLALQAYPASWVCGLAVVLLLAVYGPYYLPHRPAQANGPVLTVMTYNVLCNTPEAAPVLAQVATQSPDLIAFQEFQPPKSGPITAALARDYPYHDVQGTYGLFSRYPISACGLVANPDEPGYLAQRCQVELAGRSLAVFNVHLRTPSVQSLTLPWLNRPLYLGVGPARRDDGLDVVFEQADRLAGSQLIVGDFNLTDQASVYTRLRARWDDAYRSAGWGLGFSFRRLGLPLPPLWRIDYIFYTPDLAALEAYLGDFGASDHRPVVARVGFKD